MSGATGALVLELDGFGFAFGDRTVVRAIDLTLLQYGMSVLVGPVATGKSSSLRLLAGDIGPASGCQSWGVARYRSAPLGELGRPALATQRARLLLGSVFETIAEGLVARAQMTRPQQRDAASAPEALSHMRRVEPRFVQSTEQMEILRRFSASKKVSHTSTIPDPDTKRNIIYDP